ncbi:MAG: hypothetical protein K2X77_06805 [Candidatus Obscuribacterales bacterium]|nr:hypothetical protein [Candidatus Obscuribacterales bacterium]
MIIQTDGPIRQFELPENWYGEPIYTPAIRRTFWEFSPQEDSEVKWIVFCDGHKYDGLGARFFDEKLFVPKQLIDGPASMELAKLIPPNPGCAGIDNLRFESGSLKGRRVLTWYREYSEKQQKSIQKIADAAGDASIILDIAFSAPIRSFDRFFAEAQSITDSIVWVPIEEEGEWKDEAGPYGMYVNGERVVGRQAPKKLEYEDWLSRHPQFRFKSVDVR